MGEPGGQEGSFSGRVTSALRDATSENHDSRTDPAVTAAKEVADVVGGDKKFRSQVQEIAEGLAKSAQKSTYVDETGIGQPSKPATDMAEVELDLAKSAAAKREKQNPPVIQEKKNQRDMDPLAVSARKTMGEPWNPYNPK